MSRNTVSPPWAVWVLTALAVLAPFNFKVTADAWTDLELRILIIVALTLVVVLVIRGVVVSERTRPDLIDSIAYLWFGAVWTSALLSADVVLGIGGAARLSVPILLIPATRSAIRRRRDAQRVLQGLAIGSLTGAAVGLAVWIWGADYDATKVFVGEVTMLGPFTRLTRPWAHANVAAMALGATMATTATLRPRWRVGAAAFLVVSLVLTVSRGGLLAAGAAAVAWIVLRRDRIEVVGIAVLVVVGGVAVATSSGWNTRADQLGDEAFYAVTIDAPEEFAVRGIDDLVLVEVTNNSSVTWKQQGDDRVLISARWIGDDDQIWNEDWWELPSDLAPTQSLSAPLSVDARLPVGNYDVRWDLVVPRTAYFGQFLGDPPVVSRASVLASEVALDDIFRYDFVEREIGLGRVDTWRLAWRDFRGSPLFGVGPNQFGDAVTAELASQQRQVGAHAHNIVLEPLATWGLFGTIPFLLLGGLALFRAGSQASTSRALLPTVLTVGLVAVVVHGLVDWPLVVITTGIPIGLLVGLALADLEAPDAAATDLEAA